MKILKYTWTIFYNLIVLFIAFGVLNIPSTSFEKVTTSLLILIYLGIIESRAQILQLQFKKVYLLSQHFISLAKTISHNFEKFELIENENQKAWDQFRKIKNIYYINSFFNLVLTIIATLNILLAIAT